MKTKILTSLIIFLYILPCIFNLQAEPLSKAKKRLPMSLNDIQSKVNKINKNLDKLEWWASGLGIGNADIQIKEEGEAEGYYKGDYNKVKDYKKLIIIHPQKEGNNTFIDIYEYYFIKNITYVLRMKTYTKFS